MITGAVNHIGGVAHGTGFAVTQTNTGRFTVTFGTPFSDVPLVLGRAQNVDNTFGTHNVTASGFEAQLNDLSGNPADAGFFFEALDYT